jgi:methionyl-tRNA formyltransferase
MVRVEPGDDIAAVLDRLDAASMEAFAQLSDDIAAGGAQFVPQSPTGASYAGARRPEDGLIEWTWSAERLVRFIRAQTRPYPGAFSMLDGEEVRIWAAELHPEPCFGIPGQVLRLTDGQPVVACGNSTGLVLTEIEAAIPPRFNIVRTRFGGHPSI